jgi:hypothetical protein
MLRERTRKQVRLLIGRLEDLLVTLPSFKMLWFILTESAGRFGGSAFALAAVSAHWVSAGYYFESFFGVPFGGPHEAKFGLLSAGKFRLLRSELMNTRIFGARYRTLTAA